MRQYAEAVEDVISTFLEEEAQIEEEVAEEETVETETEEQEIKS